ncbi:TrmB family transcriptional regulator sugar-binding domain-containing protein [Haloarcula nitratireducens]|uniref:TrmB family transcriptional regulator n=1 Tax=Haloarcula nitratireducens TaxID=2487749 RepID=A0AAW4PDK6_9EURY|nr:TrmB family transcriptional regulator sugar-binding domain-containing protein [Halomicroarcula nitratireducens]MBX0296026.1 TrmB family transcriptional regulator [Halomicroarcula nitratireducens]
MATDRLRDHLEAFGLSEKEVEAYLAVLRAGEATTSEVSRAADVSQGYVYELAGALTERGLVTIDETASPTVLRARPPEEAMGSFASRLEEVRESVEALYTEPAAETGTVEVVHSRPTVRKRAERYLREAEQEAFLVLPAPEVTRLRDALAAARERGVFVYVLAVAPLTEDALDRDWAACADVVRTWDATPPAFVLADETTGLIGSHGILSGRHGEEYAVAFAQREIASGLLGNTVANFWPMGEDCYVADPDPLPTTYDHLRTAATNAALHRAAGRDLLADVTLRDLDDEEVRYERVPVVAVRQNLVGDPNNDFPFENNIVFETPDGRVAAGNAGGGISPFYEGYGATVVTLYGD